MVSWNACYELLISRLCPGKARAVTLFSEEADAGAGPRKTMTVLPFCIGIDAIGVVFNALFSVLPVS